MQSVQKEGCISFHTCAVSPLSPFIHLNCVCDGYFWCSVLSKIWERTSGAQHCTGTLNREICRNSSVLFHLCLVLQIPLHSDSITQSPISQQDISFNPSIWPLSPCKKKHLINIFQLFLSASINQNQQKLSSLLSLLEKKKLHRNSWLFGFVSSDSVEKHRTLSYLCLIFWH